MKATEALHRAGQSIWLDYISRPLLESGGLARYVAELSVTGLTSNPTIFDQALKSGSAYDAQIREEAARGLAGEALFTALALEDIGRAADLFRPIHDRTDRVDGWVSIELSPKLAYDTAGSIAAAKETFARAKRPNVFVKIPGTPEGVPAIEEAIFAGVPINVTLLFSREQYLAAARAYLRGIERRIAAGLDPRVGSVASLFVSRWDVAVAGKLPDRLHNRLGIAVATQTYKAYRDLLDSDRAQRLATFGARPQRLLWGSTGTKDPKASELLYVAGLAAPNTVNTIPEKTLHALAKAEPITRLLPRDGGDADDVLDEIARAGVDLPALAEKLQRDGAAAFVKSWDALLAGLAEKTAAVRRSA